MLHSPASDALAATCSSSSSDECPESQHRDNERLVDLLTRPRSRGGYGGRLSYGEFSTLARSLGWNSEDMDDCWYDIMMGEPSAEAVDMARAAECICSYCLASPLPLLENYKLDSSTPASSSSTSTASIASMLTPRGHATPPVLPSTTVVLSPPSPVAPAAATPPKTPDPQAKASAARRSARRAFPRYAVDTLSSERRRLTASPRGRAKAPATPAAARLADGAGDGAAAPPPANTVFFRLYENGLEQQRRRHTVKPAESTEECTFQPKIQPYKAKDDEPSTVRYNKPTKSYFAKLTAEERSRDTAARSPETPRVTYHPAPGPSASVPVGYVEGVARLRHFVASRYEHADLKRSLRDPFRADVRQLVEAPILRLPVTVEGVADAVDVRLASTTMQRSPSRQRAAYCDAAVGCSAASTPRPSPGSAVRYKEHLRPY